MGYLFRTFSLTPQLRHLGATVGTPKFRGCLAPHVLTPPVPPCGAGGVSDGACWVSPRGGPSKLQPINYCWEIPKEFPRIDLQIDLRIDIFPGANRATWRAERRLHQIPKGKHPNIGGRPTCRVNNTPNTQGKGPKYQGASHLAG
jgi:hypothetical protein